MTRLQDAPGLLKRDAELVTLALEGVLNRLEGVPAKLVESIRYSIMAGGKRLRPTLVLESSRACAGGTAPPAALAAACAIELIHTFSLVHDDLPAMDNDDLRRGVPTNHKVFGEAMAILAGDAMVVMAFKVLATQAPEDLTAALVKELAKATGPSGMIGGQVLDMEGEKRTLSMDELKNLHSKKTGALISASCRLGAISAKAGMQMVEAITGFGQHLGLAFQIVDDLLDVTASSEQMGKSTGKDQDKGKNTYPALMGIDRSRTEAEKQYEQAVRALEPLGNRADGLRALARFVVDRKN
jgi:geranylgeranyl diphosphate synthase, type II